MANATVSRLGQALATGDANALFLKKFSGEVLSVFQRENLMLNMVQKRTLTQGKSASFAITGKTSSSYHTVGTEITGTAIKHQEKIINLDDMLVSSAFVAELDEIKSSYEVRSIYSSELARALSNRVDKHLLSLMILASQASANISGDTAGGLEITDADSNTNMDSMISSIFEGIQRLDENDVPSNDRVIVVNPDIYYKLANVDKLVSRDFSDNNGDFGRGTVVAIGGVPVIKSNTAVDAFADQSGDSTTGQNNTYTGDFSNHTAVLFHKSAIGALMAKNLVTEVTYDPRRLGTLMTARMVMGAGILRPECAVSIKTA